MPWHEPCVCDSMVVLTEEWLARGDPHRRTLPVRRRAAPLPGAGIPNHSCASSVMPNGLPAVLGPFVDGGVAPAVGWAPGAWNTGVLMAGKGAGPAPNGFGPAGPPGLVWAALGGRSGIGEPKGFGAAAADVRMEGVRRTPPRTPAKAAAEAVAVGATGGAGAFGSHCGAAVAHGGCKGAAMLG